jgi:2'-5' RNA ligase
VPRVRLGVVLLVPPPVADEVDGLRRALGDPALDRVPPHITLVPPVNVRVEDVPDVLAALRRAASQVGALDLAIGPPRTFGSDEGVVYLEVGGSDASSTALERLHRACRSGPLDRPLDHPFVPHVTVTTGVAAEEIERVLQVLHGYAAVPVAVARLHLLHQQAEPPHRWVPIADVPLGRAVVVGRGGLPIELTASELLDPEAAAALTAAGDAAIGHQVAASAPIDGRPLVVVARREGAVVAVAQGWTAGPVTELASLQRLIPDDSVVEHLEAAFWSAVAEREPVVG